jgi:hypothetical protein
MPLAYDSAQMVMSIDLVLIDQQRVGNRSLHMYPMYEFATFNTCSIASSVAINFLWKSRFDRPLKALVSILKTNANVVRVAYSMQTRTSNGHCQCQKQMDDHLLACQQFSTESHIVTRVAIERASFLNIDDINDISFFGTSDCYLCCSKA